MISAPTRPPPAPLSPGFAAFGDFGVWQQAVESPFAPPNSASSNVTISMPPALYAGEARIFGAHFWRNTSADFKPPGRLSEQGPSCPSLRTVGGMNDRFGVFAADVRSPGSTVSATFLVLQVGESM